MDVTTLDKLAGRVAEGDKGAYTLLLQEAARIVRGYVYARVTDRDRAAVEDIVQETLLAIHTKYQSYDPSLPFLPWLRTIAHHKLVDHWRRQKIAFLVTIEESDEILVASDAPRTDASLTLEKMFETLNDKQRRIVQLAKLEGKSMAEIAAEMSISVSDVKVTLHRAIQKLTDIAQQNDEGSHAHG